jgi:glucan phosphoethanolaminetransferase (alkaline phosphatase superfamily)
MKVNYFYFGILFVILSCLHIYHLLLIQNISPAHYSFYILYACAQCLIETALLALLSTFITNPLFTLLTFLLFLAHIVDFSTIRILGMTVWYIFGFIFAESFDNFIEMLYATHLSLLYWAIGGLIAFGLITSSLAFFKKCNHLSSKRPLILRRKPAFFSLGGALVALCTLGSFAPEHTHCIQTLPWKTTFATSTYPAFQVGPIAPDLSEETYLKQLEKLSLKAKKKPNIYLLIAESLRDDFITEEIAPHLALFKKPYPAFSAANGTHLSWFSIFHSAFPLYWESRDPKLWKSGSLPLRLLKTAGYTINVYSSSRLSYYRMDERLFGEKAHLVDHLHLFGDPSRQNHENDAACMAAVTKTLNQGDGQLCIIFLESTHFGYSWPSEKTAFPAPPSINYFHAAYSNEAAKGIKNRYKNAIHFIDSLFGDFLDTLKNSRFGKEAVVVFTGDHGEEFFEEGAIFHASNLSPMQTQVPLYFKLGTTKLAEQPFASHLDIFPTLLHHVFGKEVYHEWFDGESLLRPRKAPFALSARYNASRAPTEFLLHNGTKELRFRLKSSGTLECLVHRDAGKDLPLEEAAIRSSFQAAVHSLFPMD